jgi:hypothetical protein
MKIKLFSAHKGIDTFLVLATGINDAYDYLKQHHILKSKIKRVSSVDVKFDQAGDSVYYKHDREDLPETFGKNAPVSPKVYTRLMSQYYL